ncbi:MAG: hypothetical protein WAQ08_02730 [Aquabacterium sp.]|jgi:hypothetical protein|uniref:hypothetical protein n=1 Tax=Aquabacterium sp. TaxID=1872578 RepID=UPI003BAE7C52
MTAAYDLFLHELGATGREYGDGFSIGNLLQLTPQERERTRQALIECIRRGEARALKPLTVVAPGPDTVTLLESLWQTSSQQDPPEEFDVEVAAALARLTDASDALDFLEQAAIHLDDTWTQGAALDGLVSAGVDSNASARLARCIRQAADEDTRLSCADSLLQRHGWQIEDPALQDETLALLKALVSEQPADRDAALLRVLKAPARPWPWVVQP